MATTYHRGEPYRIAGKRIVFTNWHFVRSESGHDWYDENGKTAHIMKDYEPDSEKVRWNPKYPNYGVSIRTNPATRTDPIFEYEKPWEKKGLSVTMMHDEGKFRAWGTTGWHFDKTDPNNYLCYLESDDGYDWKRPNCGIIEYNGSLDNNLLSDKHGWRLHNGGVFKDPSAPPSERYKWLGEDNFSEDEYRAYIKKYPEDVEKNALRPVQGRYSGVRGAVSPDGIHWTYLELPLTITFSDTHITCYYDSFLKKYVAYYRDYMIGASEVHDIEELKKMGRWKRSIGRTESDDFRHFKLSDEVLIPDISWTPNDQLYTNCRTTIPGAPDHHIMFPAVWNTADDTIRIVMASSYNGRTWQYTSRDPVLDTAEAGKWDGGCVYTYPELLEMPNGDFAMPYTGYNVPHKYPRGKALRNTAYALWPKGRLIGMEAKEVGEFSTSAIIVKGSSIKINAVIKRAGYILTEVCDRYGKPVPGRTINDSVPLDGDCYTRRITWNNHDDTGIDEDEPFILRFKMKRACIYGLDFE